MFCYQAKLGRRCPAYLTEWLAGIVAAALSRRPPKIGVVVFKPKRGRDEDAVVLLRWRDWLELHGTPPAPVAGPEPSGDLAP